jgi:DNA-binding transcriptional LysR family regulator
MNLRQLELLRAVIRCETTVGAARELGLSQPAVSNAIKHLESQLGFPLFERINNRLFPTQEARALYQDSEPIFSMHAALESKVQDLRENKAGQIRIIATPPLGYGAIPVALQRFLAKRPKVRVAFDVRRLEDVTENVETGVSELGFVLGIGDHPALHTEPVHESRMVCVVAKGHALARRKSVSPADLAAYPFIALERGTRLGTMVRGAFEAVAMPFQFAVEVRYCHTACVLAASRIGVTVVDPFSPEASGKQGLVVIPFEPVTPVKAYVVRSRTRPLSRLAEEFLREVKVALSDIEQDSA